MRGILALLADWANGIFSVLIATIITGVQPEWWHFLISIVFANLPDLDILPSVLKHGRVMAASPDNVENHREGLHYPLVWIVGAGVLAWLFGYWGWIFLWLLVLHFVNDSYGTGWGVKWLWPFTGRNYKFIYRRVNQPKSRLVRNGVWATLPLDERRVYFIVSWSTAELPEYMRRWGYEDWIVEHYLKFNWAGLIEYAFFVVAIILMTLTLW